MRKMSAIGFGLVPVEKQEPAAESSGWVWVDGPGVGYVLNPSQWTVVDRNGISNKSRKVEGK